MAARWPWHLLLVVVTLSALPFGSNRPWAWSFAALLIGLATLGWAMMAWQGRAPRFWRPALWPVVAGFATVVLWSIVQLLPMPGGIANGLWEAASTAAGQPLGASISIAPDAAGPALLRFASYGAAFWLALQYGRDRRRAHQLIGAFVAASAAYALYGLVNFFAGNAYLLWYPRWTYMADVTGTFVNRNSYATFAGLGMLAAAAMSIRTFRDKWRVADRSQARLPRIVECFTGRPLAYAVLALVVAMAWLQTHSRMGFVATLAGLAALLLALRVAGIVRHAAVATVVGLGALVALLLSSGAGTLDRLEQVQADQRLPLFTVVTRAIEGAPWTGHGFGSFAAAFPMYRDMTLPEPVDFTQAHNSYLELAVEFGIPAAALFVAGMTWAALLCLRGVLRRRRDRLVPALAFAASVLVGVHALVDFSLQMPAVAYAFAAILGVGVAQSWSDDGARSAGSGR